MNPMAPICNTPHTTVVPWHDDYLTRPGFGARSDYVEWFWLPVLGPSATWLLRRIDGGFDQHPDGYVLDAHTTARALGIAARNDVGTTYYRALHRLIMFGVARTAHTVLVVRRVLPPVPQRHLQRMPPHLRSAHDDWLRDRPAA